MIRSRDEEGEKVGKSREKMKKMRAKTTKQKH